MVKYSIEWKHNDKQLQCNKDQVGRSYEANQIIQLRCEDKRYSKHAMASQWVTVRKRKWRWNQWLVEDNDMLDQFQLLWQLYVWLGRLGI